MLSAPPKSASFKRELLQLLIGTAIVLLMSAANGATTASTPAKPDVIVGSGSSATGTSINHMLVGTQFDYFNPVIKARQANTDLLQSWKDASIGALRYPGGTWGDHYVWDHPEKSHFENKGDNENTVLSPDEFLALSRKVGATPIFQVNAVIKGGWSSNFLDPTKIDEIKQGAQWAASWVRHVNIEEKAKVKYWEVGNELWILLRPEEYANILVEYSKAMKAVDPSIKIIACGLSEPEGPFDTSGWYKFPQDPNWKPRTANRNDPSSWNNALFTIARGSFDYVAPHPYIAVKDTTDPRSIYLETVGKVWDGDQLNAQNQFLSSAKWPVRLALTEYATNFNLSVPGKGKYNPSLYYYTLGNGVNMAHYLGQIIAGDRADIAIMHDLGDLQTIFFWPKKAMSDKPLLHPAFLALQEWATHLGTKRLATTVSSIPQLSYQGKNYPALFFFASEDESNFYLMAINLDPDSAHSVAWQPAGTTATSATMNMVTGPGIDSTNWEQWGKQDSTAPSIQSSQIAASTTSVKGYAFSIPAHSFAGITVAKNASK